MLTSNLGKIVAEAEGKAALVVAKVAHDIAAGAKERTPPRVDLGTMLNGWAARQLGPHEWEAFNPVEHSKYNEFGTRHMAAHPMIVPSAEAARPGFMQAVRGIYGHERGPA